MMEIVAEIHTSQAISGEVNTTPNTAGGGVTKDAVLSALGYTPADAPDAIVCTITGAGTKANPFACDKTTAELYTANLAGKLIYAKNNGRYIPLFAMQGSQIAYFVQPNQNGNVIGYSVRGDGSVAAIRIDVQSTDDLVTEISSESTDQQYPSAKAVWDLTQQLSGVIYDATMSDETSGTLSASRETVLDAITSGKNIRIKFSNESTGGESYMTPTDVEDDGGTITLHGIGADGTTYGFATSG